MSQDIVKALSEVDGFHKDCMLLFNDMVASIRQNTLTGSIKDLLGPEHWCVIEDNSRGRAIDSSHQGNFMFDHDGRMRFVFVLVKTAENHFRLQSPGFKAICQQLSVEVLFPLLLVTGVFEPHEAPRWRYNHENYRRWLESTLLLSVPQTAQWPDPTSYALDKLLTIDMPGGDGTQWCEKARFAIRRLTDIRDSKGVEKIVAELLSY
jgi:hypothetical protein